MEEADEYPEYEASDDAGQDRRTKRVWIVLGIVAAAAIAVGGGMLLGDYVSIPGGREDDAPRPVHSTAATQPIPTQSEPVELPPAPLPQVALAIRFDDNTSRPAISPDSWVRQQDLPRQMYGSTPVSGVVGAYLTVAEDGSVGGCTIGGSSRVEPQRMLGATATAICRALQRRARFEAVQLEAPPSAEEPSVDAGELDGEIPSVQPMPAPDKTPVSPNNEVVVRVVFRTVGQQPAETVPSE